MEAQGALENKPGQRVAQVALVSRAARARCLGDGAAGSERVRAWGRGGTRGRAGRAK